MIFNPMKALFDHVDNLPERFLEIYCALKEIGIPHDIADKAAREYYNREQRESQPKGQ